MVPNEGMPSDASERLVLDKGHYPGLIRHHEHRPAKKNESKTPLAQGGAWNAYFQITVEGPDGQTKEVFAHEPMGSKSGSKAPGWIRNLGLDPSNYDVADLTRSQKLDGTPQLVTYQSGETETGRAGHDGFPCTVELDVEINKFRGESVEDNRITDIMARV